MSDSSQNPWVNEPNAPRISDRVHSAEKANFAGSLISAICYGLIVVLLFRCIGALLNPANRTRGSIKFGLAVYAVAMFIIVTIFTATNLDLQSISYIDNREFSGNSDQPTPGPIGYQLLINSKGISVVSSAMFILNQWLADGLLLYRCCVVYKMSLCAIAFPCLMYLATLAMSITLAYHQSHSYLGTPNGGFVTLYLAISHSLNILLTLMIVGRLIMHNREIRKARGVPAGAGGSYKADVTIFTESCFLYSVTQLLNITAWSVRSTIQFLFFPILAETQVMASLLIVLRVSNWATLTRDGASSGSTSLIRFGSRGKSTTGDGTATLPYRNLGVGWK